MVSEKYSVKTRVMVYQKVALELEAGYMSTARIGWFTPKDSNQVVYLLE